MFFFLLFISLSFLPVQASTVEDLSRHPKWIKLLHYKKNLLGKIESEADGKDFFLHPEGKTNPLAELKKSIEIFSSEPRPKDGHGICKFPLRFKWLNQQMGYPWKVDLSGCETYISFFSKLAARRASIVFSSYYLSNPNSAFGHTLLRLSRYEDRDETEMLDYGINFSAEARATNPFSYAIKGLLGGYEGRFAAIPYYYKIREYSDAEFRDLWSYDLKLTMPQVLEMVDHIWELGHTHFDYYYFHENCSYHLLGLLDVVLPEKDLTSHFNYFTIPADTIRLLEAEGLLENGKRRASAHSRLQASSRGLKQDQLALAKKIALEPLRTTELIQGSEDEKAAQTLDVAIEAFDYYHAEKLLRDHGPTMELKEHILKARASNPEVTETKVMETQQIDSPALGHAPSRLTTSAGYEKNGGMLGRLELRTAFHDLLDPERGSLQEGELEMFRFSFIYSQDAYRKGSLAIDQISILSLKNFPSQDYWSSPLSWEIGSGLKGLERSDCLDCPAGYFTGSVGNSLHLKDRRVLIAFLLNGELLVHNEFAENFQLGVGPKVYSRWKLAEKFIAGLSVSYQWSAYEDQNYFKTLGLMAHGELRYHFHRDYSFTVSARGVEQDRRWGLRSEAGLQYFY